MWLRIENEYDRLEAVLVHRPGLEIDRLTHDSVRRFLFEDVPFLRRMQDEHDAFVERLREHGVAVQFLRNLLRETLSDPDVQSSLIAEVCRAEAENLPGEGPSLVDDLRAMAGEDLEALIEVFFSGLTRREHAERTGRPLDQTDEEAFLLPPIPNAYFSRDPAVVVRDAAIIAKMHHAVRVRETLLVRTVLENHPEFRDNPITYGGTDEPGDDRPHTIEGGDVIVLSPEAVLIGCSERTQSKTIQRLAARCFQFGRVQRVYEIPVPTERAFMHLDTVMTVLDRGKVLWYPPVMEALQYIRRYEADDDGQTTVQVREDRGILEVLREEFGTDVQVVETGGGRRPYTTRDQRMDGANVLAVAPGTVICYERTERTTRALQAAGVTCVGIDDSELVRGLGGPRCMTMPLRRAPGK